MEDLAEKGYVNCERRNLLDLDHTVFALKVYFPANLLYNYINIIIRSGPIA